MNVTMIDLFGQIVWILLSSLFRRVLCPMCVQMLRWTASLPNASLAGWPQHRVRAVTHAAFALCAYGIRSDHKNSSMFAGPAARGSGSASSNALSGTCALLVHPGCAFRWAVGASGPPADAVTHVAHGREQREGSCEASRLLAILVDTLDISDSSIYQIS